MRHANWESGVRRAKARRDLYLCYSFWSINSAVNSSTTKNDVLRFSSIEEGGDASANDVLQCNRVV
jgi:hypothetical protein